MSTRRVKAQSQDILGKLTPPKVKRAKVAFQSDKKIALSERSD
jgi:hypothetical protein